MSQVYEKDRKKTKLQCIITGMELQCAVLKYVMKEENMPKKWRYFIGQDFVKITNRMLENIISGNAIYPVNEHELQIRKDYQTQALACCRQMQSYIHCLKNCVDETNLDILRNVFKILAKEYKLLLNWKKANKIIK